MAYSNKSLQKLPPVSPTMSSSSCLQLMSTQGKEFVKMDELQKGCGERRPASLSLARPCIGFQLTRRPLENILLYLRLTAARRSFGMKVRMSTRRSSDVPTPLFGKCMDGAFDSQKFCAVYVYLHTFVEVHGQLLLWAY